MDILLCGVGGQGTVLASKLLAQCAAAKGLPVHTAETIGMAQRGGCVASHVRIGADTAAPLLPFGTADLLIAFEPAEAVRALPYLKQGGAAVVNTRPLQAVTGNYEPAEMLDYLTAHVANLTLCDATGAAERCGNSKALNSALLGEAARAGVLGFDVGELCAAVEALLPERHRAVNLAAIRGNF